MDGLMKRPLKLYLDTSIPNFLFAEDAPEERKVTESLFREPIQSRYGFYISGVVLRELEKAPADKARRLMEAVRGMKVLELTEESERLAMEYLKSGALPKSSEEDARHIAVATVHNLDAVVSWNFKHLVNIRRIKSVNVVHDQMGSKHMEIISPREVVEG